MKRARWVAFGVALALLTTATVATAIVVTRDDNTAVAQGDSPLLQASPSTTRTTVAPTTTSTLAPLPVPDPPPADAYADVPVNQIGSISIPKIGLEHPIYEGIWLTVLDHGPGHWPNSALPGQRGNAVFPGHRVTHTHPFLDLDRLAPGDQITFHMPDADQVYSVTQTIIVKPTDMWVVDQTETPTVTLIACHPKHSAAQRIVVKGDLVATVPENGSANMTERGTITKPVALVTGASLGIGEQFARLLAERGNDLVLVARDSGRLEALAKELEAKHGNHCEVLAADLIVAEERRVVERRVADVDVLVNNAGFGSFGNCFELDVDAEDRQIQLNVVALMRLTHAAARGMVPRGRGGILNVASLAGFQPTPNNATYAATKAFVLSFSQAVHEELKGTGVAVSVLAPGFTHTEFQARADFDPKSVPGFLWQEAEPVARAGLDGLAKNRAVIVPGAMNKVAAGLSSVAPFSVSRRVAHVAVKRA